MVFVSFRFSILCGGAQWSDRSPVCGCSVLLRLHFLEPLAVSVAKMLLALLDMLHNPGKRYDKLLFVWDNLYRSSSHLISLDTSAVLFCA